MRRTFIAIDIKSNKALTSLVESYRIKLKEERIKWVDPANLHLTLTFLGEIDEDQIIRAGEIIIKAANNCSPFEIFFSGTGVFRSIKQPRVIWLGIEAPQSLFDLHKDICEALRKEDLYREEKPFRPHLTLGRMKYITKREVLSKLLSSSESINLPPQTIHELLLYESILKPEGPVYQPLKRALFKGNGQ